MAELKEGLESAAEIAVSQFEKWIKQNIVKSFSKFSQLLHYYVFAYDF